MRHDDCAIKLQKVSHSYQNDSYLFQPLSYVFKPGIAYGIEGPSGIGKTTLLTIIADMLKPSVGTISYENTSLSYVFQQPLLIDELSIIENIMIGAWNSFNKNLYEQAHQLLESFHLEKYAHERPRNLSIGQQQRVCLARSLIKKPTFLIADEPTAALDDQAKKDLFEVLLSCMQQYNIGLIIGSHDHYLLNQLHQIITLKKP